MLWKIVINVFIIIIIIIIIIEQGVLRWRNVKMTARTPNKQCSEMMSWRSIKVN